VFDHPVIQRCQLHKLRNVCDRLPDAVASTVAKRMRRAYHHAYPLVAQAELEALARELDRAHPGAAASLREGLAETLTITRLACRRRWRARYAAPTRSGCSDWRAGSRDRSATWPVMVAAP
jgi:transposase-like protein